MRKKIIAGVLAFAALFAIACGAKPTITGGGQGNPAANAGKAPAGPQKFTVGQKANLTLANGTVAEVTVSSVKAQGKHLVVSVTVACISGAITYNLFDWSTLAGDGTKLDAGFDPDVPNQLSSGGLGAGQKVTGNIIFQGTAAQAKGAQVQFTVGLDTIAYWVNP